MLRPLRLKRPIDPSSNVDPGDTMNAKRALFDLGMMNLPEFGLTAFPDVAMFDGIKDLQREQGLRIDGVMKPEGPTQERLNAAIQKLRNSLGRQSIVRPPAIGLTDDVGHQKQNKPHDVYAIQYALAWAGYSPAKQSDRQTDLTDAIRSFQRRNGLIADGILRPHGETEKLINRVLSRQVNAAYQLSDSENGPANRSDDSRQAEEIATIPAIVYRIAEFFGIAVMAAWAWWQSMSNSEKEHIRWQLDNANTPDEDDDREAQCDYLHYDVDRPKCNAISKKRGKQAAQQCWASAVNRYAACLKGVPMDRLPPLDVWNN